MQTPNTLQAAPGQSSGAVRIGLNHGYAFDGDSVQLDAELLVTNAEEAAGQEWALQLWACEAPFNGQPVRAAKIAELPVGSLDAGSPAWVSAFTAACPPAGQAGHSMVLVLAAGRDGHFDQVLDYANFPRTETFVQPRLVGSTGFSVGETTLSLSVDGIDNPRGADNLSGTLSLELWALDAPFSNGNPKGVQLAASTLGSLAGQSSLQSLALDLPLAARPAGTWHIALLLREWTAFGYVTRDFTNFALPLSWEAEAVAAPAAKPAAAATPVVATKTAAEAKPAPKAKPAAKPAAAAPKAAATPGTVSVNKASEAELAAVKGLPKAVASAIIATRPFKTLDELVKVKGMGVKMLDKLKGSLSL
ncbi:MAG: helix-hairpin-helix domain-containing protein [Zoogloea sp.]|nr:helix-hairpin-helix domain-containing protein [Zoogloea sp.]